MHRSNDQRWFDHLVRSYLLRWWDRKPKCLGGQ